MTPRRVILTLEVETDAPIRELRDASNYALTVFEDCNEGSTVRVIQAQANVVRKPRTGHGDNR